MLGERVHMEPLHRLTAVPLPFQGRFILGSPLGELAVRSTD